MDRRIKAPRALRPWRRALGWTGSALLIATFAQLADHLLHLERRYEDLESARLEEDFDVRRDLYDLHELMVQLGESLQDSSRRLVRTARLTERVGQAEDLLGDMGQRIAAHSTSLERFERDYRAFGPEALAHELTQRDERLNSRWDSLNELVASVQEAANISLHEVERLEAGLSRGRDLTRMWRGIVAPVAQLAGEGSVGSGVLLHSRQGARDHVWRTHLLTAWHVVRDIQGSLDNQGMPVPVFIYLEDGEVREEEAALLAFDAELDAALLLLETADEIPFGATLAPPERLERVRIFDEVYAVGCPLGNDPIPTHGEIATIRHRVDGESYWMINAPTYIGNSGGGIFDSQTHELLGIFSKIYTHGTLRPTIVPHMGLVTPLSAIYRWLGQEGFAYIVPGEPGPSPDGRLATASAPR